MVTPIPISWSITTTADGGAGSLRQVFSYVNEVGNANAAGLDARLMFELVSVASPPAPTVFTLATALPEISAAVEIIGFGIALDGLSQASSGLVFGAAASGSWLQGVTFRNFTGFGVQLNAPQNVIVDKITVQSLNTSTSMGLYATGNLTGTKVFGSTFSGGLRGALLDGARNLVFGQLGAGMGNLLSNNRAAPRQPKFAGTGIRAQGDCTDTVVEGNTFTNNNYGFAFIGARNLILRNNAFARNSTAGIYIEADSAGSRQTGNTFGAGSDRNKVNVLRAKRSRFG